MSDELRGSVERLRAFVTSARLAVEMAKFENPSAMGLAGVGWHVPDGSGALTARFDSEPFCDDLDAVLKALASAEAP